MYRKPSGPKPIQWPLWLNCGQSMAVIIRSLSGSALFGLSFETRNSATKLVCDHQTIFSSPAFGMYPLYET